MTSFVDTNIFIHYLLGYERERFDACRDLLLAAEQGQTELETSVVVIAELIWFLERPPLRTPPARVRDLIAPLVRLPGLRLAGGDLVHAALEQHAASTMNFVDAYNLILMRRRRIERLYSYDTDFDGVPGVERVEPLAASHSTAAVSAALSTTLMSAPTVDPGFSNIGEPNHACRLCILPESAPGAILSHGSMPSTDLSAGSLRQAPRTRERGQHN